MYIWWKLDGSWMRVGFELDMSWVGVWLALDGGVKCNGESFERVN